MHLHVTSFLLSLLVTMATARAQGRPGENNPSFPASYPTLTGARRFINGPTSTSVDQRNRMLARLTAAGLERIGGQVESSPGGIGNSGRWIINGHSYSLDNEDAVLPVSRAGGDSSSRFVWRGEATKEGPRHGGTGLNEGMPGGVVPSRTIQLSEAGDVYEEAGSSKIIIGGTQQDPQDVMDLSNMNVMPMLKGDEDVDSQDSNQTSAAVQTEGQGESNATQGQGMQTEDQTDSDSTQTSTSKTENDNTKSGTPDETQSNASTQTENRTGTDATQRDQSLQKTQANQTSTASIPQNNTKSDTPDETLSDITSPDTQLKNTSVSTSENPTGEKDTKDAKDSDAPDTISRSRNPASSKSRAGEKDSDSSISDPDPSSRDSTDPENPVGDVNDESGTPVDTDGVILSPDTDDFNSQAEVINKTDSSDTMAAGEDVARSGTAVESGSARNEEKKQSGSYAIEGEPKQADLAVPGSGSSSEGVTQDPNDVPVTTTTSEGEITSGNFQDQTDLAVTEGSSDIGTSSDGDALVPGSVPTPSTNGTANNVTGHTLHPSLVQNGTTTEMTIISEQSTSATWQVFQVFIFLSVMGVVVLCVLYWRRRRNMQDDEIPVFTRHTDYQNPTFNMEDATNFMARVGRGTYKTLD